MADEAVVAEMFSKVFSALDKESEEWLALHKIQSLYWGATNYAASMRERANYYESLLREESPDAPQDSL